MYKNHYIASTFLYRSTVQLDSFKTHKRPIHVGRFLSKNVLTFRFVRFVYSHYNMQYCRPTF